MADDVLTRLTERFGAKPTTAEDENPVESDAGAFGFLRGARDRGLMLEFRLKDGRVCAYSYSLLDRLVYDPSDGLRLRFAGQEVHVTGRRLNERNSSISLVEAVIRHRATWIKEASRADGFAATASDILVDSIRLP